MFGLTFEKLLLVAVVAGVLVGPQRLPHYAEELARLVRAFRAFVDSARTEAASATGVLVRPDEWDLSRYDPRRIVREAMDDPPGGPSSTRDPDDWALRVEAAQRVRPGQVHVVVGSAAHPRRIRIDSLPPDDPRRRAAQPPGDVEATQEPASPELE